jgi:hypothetical protein
MRPALLSRLAHQKRPGPVSWYYNQRPVANNTVIEIPKNVVDSAERIGGYLGIDECYFDANGDETSPLNAKYLVVGNYYGSAIYAVDGAVRRLRGFE